MKKISQTVVKIFLIILLFQTITIPKSNASFWGDIFSAGDNFLNQGKTSSNNIINGQAVQNEVEKIYNILFAIGVVLTVLVGAVLGITFMVGSIEQQAKIKEWLLIYVVGCIVIFAAFTIWKIVITVASQIA